MRAMGRRVVIVLIGAATAWIWIRLGLYGFGIPVGFAALIPLLMLGVLYARSGRLNDIGVLLGSFALVWAAFETWNWLNAVLDPAVSIPGWTPVPLATAVACLVIAGTMVIASPPAAAPADRT